MEREQKETITTRLISVCFTMLALAVFKPFGLDAWHWQAYVHLLAFGLIGFVVCMLTDCVLKYLLKMPLSINNGISYIIRRNLWFQIINTPLGALMICIYRPLVLSAIGCHGPIIWKRCSFSLSALSPLAFIGGSSIGADIWKQNLRKPNC